MKPGDLVLVEWNSSPPETGLLIKIYDGIQQGDLLRSKVLIRGKIRLIPTRFLKVIDETG